MNHNNRRKHAILYLRQGIISLLLLALTLYLGITTSLTQTLLPPTVTDISQLSSENYIYDHPTLQLHLDKLYYTGYDNYSNNKITGHFYYSIQNNYCLLVLLDASDESPKQTIDSFKGTFKITTEDTLYNHMIQQLSKDAEWSSRSLQGITLPVIASQPDAHFIPAIIFAVGLLICIIAFGYGTISNFYYYFRYF